MSSQRYKLTIAYRGTAYHGWQAQAATSLYKGPAPEPGQGIPTIQEKLRRAIESVVRHEINLVGSSRTDAGVHAKGQVAHFDTRMTQIPAESLRAAVNARLPEDIVVRGIEAVADSFDAIKSTVAKRYQYVIWHAGDRPALFADLVWHRWQKLDVPAMAAATERLVGTHDFASFAKPGHGRENTIRTVHECSVHYRTPKLIIGVAGSGFLWQMIRIIVGTLVEVGLGRYSADDVAAMLAAKDRSASGPTAPARGLFLQWIRTSNSPVERSADGAIIPPGC